jgi:hypothetical protein
MRFLTVIALSAAACLAQDAGLSRNVLNNRDVMLLADAGFGEDFIVDMIGASRPEFDTTAGAIAEIKKHGVKDGVIRAMLGGRPSGSSSAKPEFGGGATPIRVFIQFSPDPRVPESHSQTAEIVQAFAGNCPSLMVTSRKDAATFLVLLDRTSGKLLRHATSTMVVLDRGGDTVYGSDRALPKAVRGFCPLAEKLAAVKVEESLPGSRLSAR